jgi:hypothetical protein
MAQQRVEAVADQVPRGLVAGEQEEYALRVEVLRCELRLAGNLQHEVEKIAFVLPRALTDDHLEERHELPHRSLGRSRRSRSSRGIAKPGCEVGG